MLNPYGSNQFLGRIEPRYPSNQFHGRIEPRYPSNQYQGMIEPRYPSNQFHGRIEPRYPSNQYQGMIEPRYPPNPFLGRIDTQYSFNQFHYETSTKYPFNRFRDETSTKYPLNQLRDKTSTKDPFNQFIDNTDTNDSPYQLIDKTDTNDPPYQLIDKTDTNDPPYQLIPKTDTNDSSNEFDYPSISKEDSYEESTKRDEFNTESYIGVHAEYGINSSSTESTSTNSQPSSTAERVVLFLSIFTLIFSCGCWCCYWTLAQRKKRYHRVILNFLFTYSQRKPRVIARLYILESSVTRTLTTRTNDGQSQSFDQSCAILVQDTNLIYQQERQFFEERDIYQKKILESEQSFQEIRDQYTSLESSSEHKQKFNDGLKTLCKQRQAELEYSKNTIAYQQQ
ncbi:unnamed protein product [Adineta steineri]|uniref:Uncharacterized protein n=1 Tax=Adineta steineri TaxID=433720 RepID=A0A816DIE7_9BILA|nr:unnamed protein product [Adineta steineri]CAF1637793.1 unnamed protein product [Adineta steineri]